VPELTDLELRNQSDRYLDLRELQAQLERTGGGRRSYPSSDESSSSEEQNSLSRPLVENLEGELQ